MSKDKELTDAKTIGELFDVYIEDENNKYDTMTLKDYAIAIEEAKTYEEVKNILIKFSADDRFAIENIMSFSTEDRVYLYYIMSRRQNMRTCNIFDGVLENFYN